MWEETPSGKAQVGGEATCIGPTCARTDVELFYGHQKGRNYLLMPACLLSLKIVTGPPIEGRNKDHDSGEITLNRGT